MEIFSRFTTTDIPGLPGTFVHYDEVDLKVNITDLVQQRKEEAVQLLKGKDVDALSVEDTRAMNNLISKYENLIEEREREKLAEHCLGLSWEVIRSEWNVKEAVSLIEENIGKEAPKERNKAIKKARLFLEVLLTSDDLKFRKRAELILNHLAEIKTEYENKGKRQSNTYPAKTELDTLTHKERALFFYYRMKTGSYSLLEENESTAYLEITNKYGGTVGSFRNAYKGKEGSPGIFSNADRLNSKGSKARIEKIIPLLEPYPKAQQLAENELSIIGGDNKQR